jgi:hypothetical protein
VIRQGIAFDYSSPAELYLSRRRGRYAAEKLRTRRSLIAWMQVGEDRFNKEEISRLYDEMIIRFARL